MKLFHARGAFTLIEMLVVIAIIGLLASVIFPAVSSAISRAQGVKCLSNMRQFMIALPLYAADHNGNMPECEHTSTGSPKEVRIALAPYLGADPNSSDYEKFRYTYERGYLCPNQDWQFGFNSWTSEQNYYAFMANAADVIYMADVGAGASRAIRSVTLSGLPNDFRERTPRPHKGRIGTAYLDGRAKLVKASTLVWSDFTKGSPSYIPSHDTRFVTSSEFDQ